MNFYIICLTACRSCPQRKPCIQKVATSTREHCSLVLWHTSSELHSLTMRLIHILMAPSSHCLMGLCCMVSWYIDGQALDYEMFRQLSPSRQIKLSSGVTETWFVMQIEGFRHGIRVLDLADVTNVTGTVDKSSFTPMLSQRLIMLSWSTLLTHSRQQKLRS